MNLLFLGEVLCEDVFTKIAKLPQATYGFTKYLANIDLHQVPMYYTAYLMLIPKLCQRQLHNYCLIYPPTSNMTMENQPFEDVSPTKNGDFPLP